MILYFWTLQPGAQNQKMHIKVTVHVIYQLQAVDLVAFSTFIDPSQKR